MLRRWTWIVAAIVAGALAAGFVTGVEAAVLLILPNLDPAGPSSGGGAVLAAFMAIASVPCWALGLAVLGLPVALALRRIGRDGYVSAMAAGAIGGAVSLFVVLAVFGGFETPALLIAYPPMMILPGVAAGFMVRRLAYDSPSKA
jgi:hypothetical protein